MRASKTVENISKVESSRSQIINEVKGLKHNLILPLERYSLKKLLFYHSNYKTNTHFLVSVWMFYIWIPYFFILIVQNVRVTVRSREER